jgi:hypothetical protein
MFLVTGGTGFIGGLWLDGFAEMTPQELTMEELRHRIRAAGVTIAMGPHGGVTLRYTGHIEQKALGTLTHTFTATSDAVRRDFDVFLYFNAANSVPAIRLLVASGADPNRNSESTALKLADQGGFFVGIGRKQMPYGAIAQGQMCVQYMIPAEKRYPYPVIMVHGGGAQGTHMMGLGRRPGWVHYFVQAGYSVYWLDRPSYGRSPYHPDALGPSHLPNVPPLEDARKSAGHANTDGCRFF